MPLALALLGLLLVTVPSRAEAQALRAVRAELLEGPTAFGRLGNATITITRWESGRRARVRLEDRAIALEASIDVRGESTRVLVGVGEPVALADGGPWSITMEAGTWAPLVGHGEGERPRVLLPRGLPMRRGTIVRAVTAATEPPQRTFGHAPIDWAQWSPICRGVTIRAGRDPAGPRWRLRPGAPVRVAGAQAPFAIDAWVSGFVVHGHSDVRPILCDGGSLSGGVGARACMRLANGELRVVPAGTAIRVSGTVVATLRIDVVGRARSETIELMHAEPGGASWSIAGTIDAPLASLAIASAAPEDMHVCSDVIEWPDE